MICPETLKVWPPLIGLTKVHVTSARSLRSMPGVVNVTRPVVRSVALYRTRVPVPFTRWRAAPGFGIFAMSKLDGVPAGPVQSKSVIVTDPSFTGSAWAALPPSSATRKGLSDYPVAPPSVGRRSRNTAASHTRGRTRAEGTGGTLAHRLQTHPVALPFSKQLRRTCPTALMTWEELGARRD